jgi:hypothetical protein
MSKTWEELHRFRFIDEKKTMRLCVDCGVAIQKKGGCNFIRCTNCKAEWDLPQIKR